MMVWRTRAILCGLLGAASVIPLVAADDATPPAASPMHDAMQVTSDGETYCRGLGVKVDATVLLKPQREPQVADVIREGKAQCAAGHYKIGIHWLRVALVTLNGD